MWHWSTPPSVLAHGLPPDLAFQASAMLTRDRDFPARRAPLAEAPREMAAVMFTDVRGYSSLAQRDEALALRLLELNQRLAEPLIAEHHGRLVKTIGDALMVEFKSALAAV